MASPQLTWLVTGCSPGSLGYSLALQILERGDRLIATTRNAETRLQALAEKGATIMSLDTTWSTSELQAVAQKAITAYGSVDVLVNNAGYLEVGSFESLGNDKLLKSVQALALGPLDLTRALLPHFRERKSGTVLFIGSITPYMNAEIAGATPYLAAKGLLEGVIPILAEETSMFGVRYCNVVAGFIRTKLFDPKNLVTETLKKTDAVYDPFNQFVSNRVEMIHGNQPADPDLCAKVIVDAVRSEGSAAGKKLPLRLPLGNDATPVLKGKIQELESMISEWGSVADSVVIVPAQ